MHVRMGRHTVARPVDSGVKDHSAPVRTPPQTCGVVDGDAAHALGERRGALRVHAEPAPSFATARD